MTHRTLDEIGTFYGTDKASTVRLDWQWAVSYLNTYDELFTPIRDEPITLLELGWGEWDPEQKTHANPNVGGRSARMWREYFPYASIHIVDIEAKKNTVSGVELWQGDQTDKKFLDGIASAAGGFDIVVDDCSHISSKTIRSFEILWEHVKPGGFYCIEDLHSSYHAYWFGADEASADPRTPCRGGRPTAMQYFLDLTHDVNYRGQRFHGPWANGAQTTEYDCYARKHWRGHHIDYVMFRYQLCVIRKAP